MRELTEHQLDFLVKFFSSDAHGPMSSRHSNWKEVAITLINKGKCVVAGKECIWVGYMGNHIKTTKNENFVGCLEYSFNLDEFLGGEFFRSEADYAIKGLVTSKKEIEQRIEEIKGLL